MRHVTLRQLRALLAIHAEGKIVNAAKALRLTAPAITLQLKQLEEEAGVVLFDRTAQGMRPTAAGLAVIEAAQAIEERLRGLGDEIDAIRGARRGSLVVGAVSTAKYFAPQVVAGFMREYPDVDLKLFVGNRAQTIASLKDHRIDVALMGRPPRDVPVRAAAFGDHPLVIIAAPDHPLVGRRGIGREEVAREHFIIREPGSGTRMSFERFLGEIPGRLDEPGTEMDSNETIKQAVMAGLGVAFISGHTVAFEVETGRLAVLDVDDLPVWRQWFAVARSDRAVTPVMAAFEAFLARTGAAFLPVLGELDDRPGSALPPASPEREGGAAPWRRA
jgi:DNA-binding transcriptional LysR family regulator